MAKNNRFFFGRKFILLNGVYIPKHETEYIVEITINLVSSTKMSTPKILEVGTGSGCIITTLAYEIPYSRLFGIEKQQASYDNTILNLIKHSKYAYILLLDVFEIDDYMLNKFDIVVCNPPYLTLEEFNLKHKEHVDNKIKYMDTINCVGSIEWINKFLDKINANYIVLEISIWQAELINNKKYRVIDTLIPFKNLNICFVLLKNNNVSV